MKLISFSPTTDLEIRAKVEHRGNVLAFWYEWMGAVLDLGIAQEPAQQPVEPWSRGEELSKTTCFEAFWSEPQSKAYWELNASPLNKQWNLYRFDDYRLPQPPSPVNNCELANIKRCAHTLEFDLVAEQPWPKLEYALCAVIRHAEGTFHFASTHRGAAPDFHRRQSFTHSLVPKGG